MVDRVDGALDLLNGGQRTVRVARALGEAGRAGRVHDGDRVVGGQCHFYRAARPVQPLGIEHHRVGVAVAVGDEGARARVVEDVVDLARAEARVDADGDGADLGCAEIGDRVGEGGVQKQRHRVACADAFGPQGEGCSIGKPIPFGVGETAVAVDEGDGVRLARGGLPEERPDHASKDTFFPLEGLCARPFTVALS